MLTVTKQPPAVKLMIQSGIVPKNIIQQLIHWRMLPEDSEESIGSHPVTLEDEWPTVEAFLESLKSALVEEMKTIRETDLDQTGGFRDAWVILDNGTKFAEKLFVDRLGRIVTPASLRWERLTAVEFLGQKARPVVNKEPRYEGSDQVAIVHYLEKEKPHDAQ